MELFINESLGLYPRHPGDIQLIDPNWVPGLPLPEGWEVVNPIDPPQVAEGQYWVEVPPVKVDGIWHREFEVKTYTQEELDAIAAEKEALKQLLIEE